MSNPLDRLKQELFGQLQAQDVSEEKPLRNAFEVEDLNNHTNFVFVLRGSTVDLFNSSRGVDKRHMKTFGPDEFPFDHKTAEDYFAFVFQKSLRADDNICFLGYVEEKQHEFAPIEIEEEPVVVAEEVEAEGYYNDPHYDIGGEG
jgi:hypothetical protein